MHARILAGDFAGHIFPVLERNLFAGEGPVYYLQLDPDSDAVTRVEAKDVEEIVWEEIDWEDLAK